MCQTGQQRHEQQGKEIRMSVWNRHGGSLNGCQSQHSVGGGQPRGAILLRAIGKCKQLPTLGPNVPPCGSPDDPAIEAPVDLAAGPRAIRPLQPIQPSRLPPDRRYISRNNVPHRRDLPSGKSSVCVGEYLPYSRFPSNIVPRILPPRHCGCGWNQREEPRWKPQKMPRKRRPCPRWRS